MSRRAARWLLTAALSSLSGLALAAAFPAVLRIPPRDPGAARSLPAASFSHRGHQSFGCYACHPSIFPQALSGFTHAEMRAGRFCGQCHDGRVGFALAGAGCGGCHAPAR